MSTHECFERHWEEARQHGNTAELSAEDAAAIRISALEKLRTAYPAEIAGVAGATPLHSDGLSASIAHSIAATRLVYDSTSPGPEANLRVGAKDISANGVVLGWKLDPRRDDKKEAQLSLGPSLKHLAPGRWVVTFLLAAVDQNFQGTPAANEGNPLVATLDVLDATKRYVLQRAKVHLHDFPKSEVVQDVAFPVEFLQGTHATEFRIHWPGSCLLRIKTVSVSTGTVDPNGIARSPNEWYSPEITRLHTGLSHWARAGLPLNLISASGQISELLKVVGETRHSIAKEIKDLRARDKGSSSLSAGINDCTFSATPVLHEASDWYLLTSVAPVSVGVARASQSAGYQLPDGCFVKVSKIVYRHEESRVRALVDDWISFLHADAFAGKDVETWPVGSPDLQKEKEHCQKKGYGGFVVRLGKAHFKQHLGEQLVNARKRSMGASVHVWMGSDRAGQGSSLQAACLGAPAGPVAKVQTSVKGETYITLLDTQSGSRVIDTKEVILLRCKDAELEGLALHLRMQKDAQDEALKAIRYSVKQQRLAVREYKEAVRLRPRREDTKAELRAAVGALRRYQCDAEVKTPKPLGRFLAHFNLAMRYWDLGKPKEAREEALLACRELDIAGLDRGCAGHTFSTINSIHQTMLTDERRLLEAAKKAPDAIAPAYELGVHFFDKRMIFRAEVQMRAVQERVKQTSSLRLLHHDKEKHSSVGKCSSCQKLVQIRGGYCDSCIKLAAFTGSAGVNISGVMPVPASPAAVEKKARNLTRTLANVREDLELLGRFRSQWCAEEPTCVRAHARPQLLKCLHHRFVKEEEDHHACDRWYDELHDLHRRGEIDLCSMPSSEVAAVHKADLPRGPGAGRCTFTPKRRASSCARARC